MSSVGMTSVSVASVGVGSVSVGSVSGALVLAGMLGTTWLRDWMGTLDRPDMFGRFDMRDRPDMGNGTMRANDIRVRVAGISRPNARPAMPATLPIPAVLPGPPTGPRPGIGDPHSIPVAAAIAGVGRQELWQAHQSVIIRIHPREEPRSLPLVRKPRSGKELVQGQEAVVIRVEPAEDLPGRQSLGRCAGGTGTGML